MWVWVTKLYVLEIIVKKQESEALVGDGKGTWRAIFWGEPKTTSRWDTPPHLSTYGTYQPHEYVGG